MKIDKRRIPQSVRQIVKVFQENNFEIFLVGGAVRDLLMGHSPTDWDFTTNARPKQILRLFPRRSFYNNRFGTVGVVVKPEVVYEITTFRKEFCYTDARHPDKVCWGNNIFEDLKRRDFTINAIALKITLKENKIATSEIIDPYGGQEDIRQKIIRAVGNPTRRFREDALRLLRAIRLAASLGFVIEEKTFAAIQKNAPLITKVSWERIRDELLRLLISDYPEEGMQLLRTSGLLHFVLPELEKAIGVEQAKHHIWDVWTHSIKSLAACPSGDPIVRLATLLHDVGKPYTVRGKGETRTFHNHEVVGAKIARAIGYRLRLPKKDIDRLWRLVRWHQFSLDENQTDYALRRFIRNVGKENLEAMFALRVGDRVGSGVKPSSWRFELFKKRIKELLKQPFTVKDLKVDGHDVMRILQIKPGPLVGEVLRRLFAEVEQDKEKNKRRYLVRRIKEIGKEVLK